HNDDALETWRASTNGMALSDFSPDRMLLAVSGKNGPLILWGFASRQPLASLTNFGGDSQALDFPPDGKTLAFGSASGAIEIRDIATRQAVGTLPNTNQAISSMKFSADGKLLGVVERESPVISLWEVGSRRLLVALRSDSGGYVYGLGFSSDGRTLA